MKQISLILEFNKKEIILITHDECIFYLNDGKQGVWTKFRELLLRKKGNGHSIIVSEFLTEECSWLKLNSQQRQENPFIPEEAQVYLQLEKDQNRY